MTSKFSPTSAGWELRVSWPITNLSGVATSPEFSTGNGGLVFYFSIDFSDLTRFVITLHVKDCQGFLQKYQPSISTYWIVNYNGERIKQRGVNIEIKDGTMDYPVTIPELSLEDLSFIESGIMKLEIRVKAFNKKQETTEKPRPRVTIQRMDGCIRTEVPIRPVMPQTISMPNMSATVETEQKQRVPILANVRVASVIRPSSSEPSFSTCVMKGERMVPVAQQAKYPGLSNDTRCLCYMNAVYQCLFNIPAFVRMLYKLPVDWENMGEMTVVPALQMLFYTMQRSLGTPRTVKNTGMVRAFHWRDGQDHVYQDAGEFLGLFTDRLFNISKDLRNMFFYKVIERVVREAEAPTERISEENFMSVYSTDGNNLDEIILEKCLGRNIGPNVTKTYTYVAENLPDILVVVFSDRQQDGHVFNKGLISCPEVLDLSKCVGAGAGGTESITYRRFQFIYHTSKDHYAAVIKTPDGTYYDVSDEDVTEMTKERADEIATKVVEYHYWTQMFYVKESTMDTVLKPLTMEDVPETLRKAYNSTKYWYPAKNDEILCEVVAMDGAGPCKDICDVSDKRTNCYETTRQERPSLIDNIETFMDAKREEIALCTCGTDKYPEAICIISETANQWRNHNVRLIAAKFDPTIVEPSNMCIVFVRQYSQCNTMLCGYCCMPMHARISDLPDHLIADWKNTENILIFCEYKYRCETFEVSIDSQLINEYGAKNRSTVVFITFQKATLEKLEIPAEMDNVMNITTGFDLSIDRYDRFRNWERESSVHRVTWNRRPLEEKKIRWGFNVEKSPEMIMNIAKVYGIYEFIDPRRDDIDISNWGNMNDIKMTLTITDKSIGRKRNPVTVRIYRSFGNEYTEISEPIGEGSTLENLKEAWIRSQVITPNEAELLKGYQLHQQETSKILKQVESKIEIRDLICSLIPEDPKYKSIVLQLNIYRGSMGTKECQMTKAVFFDVRPDEDTENALKRIRDALELKRKSLRYYINGAKDRPIMLDQTKPVLFDIPDLDSIVVFNNISLQISRSDDISKAPRAPTKQARAPLEELLPQELFV